MGVSQRQPHHSCPPSDAQTVEAARLRASHRWLRLPDAFVLAVAKMDEADEVLTCDQRWAKVSERVTVVGQP
ncbi:MAG TPA: PIN domain-containing protein [Jiangellaceae bacterium]|jgi:PIN domain nuclease of toxin-antitoxin system|nr:PIN domain-containing protein [Jiangellaceae bacterium]